MYSAVFSDGLPPIVEGAQEDPAIGEQTGETEGHRGRLWEARLCVHILDVQNEEGHDVGETSKDGD